MEKIMDFYPNVSVQVKNIKKYIEQKKMQKILGFKDKHPFEKRLLESQRIREKYPTRIPVICERYKQHDPEIDRNKFLIPQDLTISNFSYIIRKRIQLTNEYSLFFFINGKTMPASCELISDLYSRHADEDGFLYIIYSGETTFG